MNQEIKNDWINSLTSGEYHQGTGALRTVKDEYCCLGVLCDVAVKAGVAQWSYQNGMCWQLIPANISLEEAKEVGVVESAILPKFVTDWAEMETGVPQANPIVVHDGDHIALTQANDGLQLPFSTIAELIRESL